MKKLIAIAALAAAGFAAPTLPVQAATPYPANCLILPLLQAECVDIFTDNVAEVTEVAASTASAVASPSRPKVPGGAWWTCTPAPEGSKGIYVCDY